jgi:hypothetical protein
MVQTVLDNAWAYGPTRHDKPRNDAGNLFEMIQKFEYIHVEILLQNHVVTLPLLAEVIEAPD